MSSSEQVGSNTDSYVTGAPETETFPTDEAPTADTPSHGSSNAGINETGANRTEPAADATGEESPEG